jgi:purine-binding chemotaxis protein CheW
MEAANNIANELNYHREGDTEGQQFLTFMLAGEEYGIDILRVQEIKGWDTVTPIPNSPQYIRGVINLRGTIVPIIDMRRRFNLEAVEYGPLTVVIVLKVMTPNSDNSRVMGIIVDAVSDVYNVDEEDIKAAPDFGSAVDVAFVQGLATMQDNMVIILDIDNLLNSKELALVVEAAGE